MIRHSIKVLISTKGEYLERKVNTALEELENNGCNIEEINSNISYSGDKGYMLMSVISYSYFEEDINELDYDSVNLNFGIGESGPDCPSL